MVTEIFATETMAELCVRQGRTTEAQAIYQSLLQRLGDAEEGRRAKWTARLAELRGDAPAGGATAARALDERRSSADEERSRDHAPVVRRSEDRTLQALESMAAHIADTSPPPGATVARPIHVGVGVGVREVGVRERGGAVEVTASAAALAVAAPEHAGAGAIARRPRPSEASAGASAAAASPSPSPAPAAPAAQTPPTTLASPPPPLRPALLVVQPVRSGQVVYAEGTDLIVLTSVNAGGQLMADGNIHVYGTLRGRAIAGVKGAREARVFCQRLDAELVGIDVAYVTAEMLPDSLRGKAAQVLLRDGQCVVLPL